MSTRPIFVSRNSAASLLKEKDYRTWLAKNPNLEPDAYLLRGRKTVPLFLVTAGQHVPQTAEI